jgi:hypothetical protein
MAAKPKNSEDKRITPGFLAQAGKGRPKGVPNKATTKIKDMITQALDKAGGVEYLTKQATENPVAFLGLVGKVLPMQLTGEDGGAIKVTCVEIIGVVPE